MRFRFRAALASALTAVVVWTTASAAAALPVQEVDRRTIVDCSVETADGLLLLGATFEPSGPLRGAFGTAFLPTRTASAVGGSGSLVAGQLSLSLSYREAGVPVGAVTVEGSVSDLGEATVIEERTRIGNVWFAVEGTLQQLRVDARVTGATGALTSFAGAQLSCQGTEIHLTHSATDPAMRIFRDAAASASCAVAEGGFLNLVVHGREASVSLFIPGVSGTAGLNAGDIVQATGNRMTGTIEIVTPAELAGQSAAVALSRGAKISGEVVRSTSGGGAVRETVAHFRLTGTITLPDSTVIRISDCVLNEHSVMRRIPSPSR